MSEISDELIVTLKELREQILHAEIAAKLSGENFNVFEILSLSSAEVRTHSAFIAELLDPKGCHGQGSIFLELFVKLKQVAKHHVGLNPSTAVVGVEQYIGPRDDVKATGGRVDIMITDSAKTRIMIENKIYAADQYLQLLRYHNFDEKAALLYLTLEGQKPSADSVGNLSESTYSCISYKDDILQWLKECHQHAAGFPIVRETIAQYMSLICKLTGQTRRAVIMKYAKELVESNPDLVDGAFELVTAWNEIIIGVKSAFEKLIEDVSGENVLVGEKQKIEYKAISDGDGLCICFRLVDASGKSSTMDDALPYANIFQQDIGKDEAPNEFHPSNSTWNIGWYTPEGFKFQESFEKIDKQKIIVWHKDKDRTLLKTVCEKIKQDADRRLEKLTTVHCHGIRQQ